jgi:hypothetical protein
MQNNHKENKDRLEHEPVKGYKKAFVIASTIAFFYLFIIFIFS